MLMSLFPALLALLLTVAPPAFGAEGVLGRIAARAKVTAAAVPDQLPVAGYDASGQLVGFDIDVSREIARRLGQPLAIVTPGWAAILSGDWGDRFDFCACSITPTKERAAGLAFPGTYRFDAAVVVVRTDNPDIHFLADASGRRIGVKAKTTFQQYLEHDLVIFTGAPVTYRIDKAQVVTYPDKEDALRAVVHGDVEASVTSLVTARGAIAEGMPLRILSGFLYFEPVAVAIAKGDEPFARRMAEIVDAMHQDGTLAALSVKWFGIDLTRVLE